MNLILDLRLEGLPDPVNKSGNKHWFIKNKQAQKWKRLVHNYCVINSVHNLMLKKASIELTRHSSKEPDFDGLVSSFKHVLDGLVSAQLIVDDKPSVIGCPQFKWEKAAANQGFITIKVWG